MGEKISVNIDSKYQRDQFDDYLAGGKVEYMGEVYHWSAQDSNYGFGWEVEPVDEDDWRDIREDEFSAITRLIERCLCEHKAEFRF